MTLLSRVHLSIEEESNSDLFKFWTRYYCQKLGISTEVEFLSDPRHGLISSPKSKFRDQVQSFWLERASGKSNPNLLMNQLCRNSSRDPDPTS